MNHPVLCSTLHLSPSHRHHLSFCPFFLKSYTDLCVLISSLATPCCRVHIGVEIKRVLWIFAVLHCSCLYAYERARSCVHSGFYPSIWTGTGLPEQIGTYMYFGFIGAKLEDNYYKTAQTTIWQKIYCKTDVLLFFISSKNYFSHTVYFYDNCQNKFHVITWLWLCYRVPAVDKHLHFEPEDRRSNRVYRS